MSFKIENTMDRFIAGLREKWDPLVRTEVEVGSMGEGGGPTPIHDEAKMPVATLLKIHEYGLGGVRERSVVRATMRKNRGEIGRLLKRAGAEALRGDKPEAVAERVGAPVRDMMLARLDQLTSVAPLELPDPNAAPRQSTRPRRRSFASRIRSTARRVVTKIRRFFSRGGKRVKVGPTKPENTKPLQETGQIRDSIRYHVRRIE